MDIRRLNGLELQQSRYIWSQAFEHGDLLMNDWAEWEERTPSGRSTHGLFDAAGLQAAFLLVDEKIHFGPEATLPMCAVCGVGVLPASRGRGYAGRGMRYVFEQMREQGYLLSFLEPFSWEFYERLGYTWIAAGRRYTVPTRVLKPSPETEFVRAARAEDQPMVIDCYTRFAQGYRGMVARRQEVWNWRFDANKKETTYTYLYQKDSGIEGYLTFHGGKREETRIDEFIALTSSARDGLLGLLRRHEMQTDKFRWDAPEDDTLWSTLMHKDIDTKLFSKTMARIVDVAGALKALRPPAEMRGQIVLAVADETAPWNNRKWRLEIDRGNCEVQETDTIAQVTLSVQALAQAYLGTLSLPQIRESGRIRIEDEAGYDALAALLAGPLCWCNDGF